MLQALGVRRKATKRQVTQFLTSDCATLQDTSLTPVQRVENLRLALVTNAPEEFDESLLQPLVFDDLVTCLVSLGRNVDDDAAHGVAAMYLLEAEKAAAVRRRSAEPMRTEPLVPSQNRQSPAPQNPRDQLPPPLPAPNSGTLEDIVHQSVERALAGRYPKRSRVPRLCVGCHKPMASCDCFSETSSRRKPKKVVPLAGSGVQSGADSNPTEDNEGSSHDEGDNGGNRTSDDDVALQGRIFNKLEVLQDPEMWETLLEQGADPAELRAELITRYVSRPTFGTHKYVEVIHVCLVDALIALIYESTGFATAAQEILDVLERGLVFLEGFNTDQVEAFMRRVKSSKMSKRYTEGWKYLRQARGRGEPSGGYGVTAGRGRGAGRGRQQSQNNRVPAEAWEMMSAEQRKAYSDKRRNRK